MTWVEELLRIIWLRPVDSRIALDKMVLLLNSFVVRSLMVAGHESPSLKHV